MKPETHLMSRLCPRAPCLPADVTRTTTAARHLRCPPVTTPPTPSLLELGRFYRSHGCFFRARAKIQSSSGAFALLQTVINSGSVSRRGSALEDRKISRAGDSQSEHNRCGRLGGGGRCCTEDVLKDTCLFRSIVT